MMTRESALELLESSKTFDRLRAARFFSRSGDDRDLGRLDEARERETDFWVKKALKDATGRIRKPEPIDDTPETVEDEAFDEGSYAKAVEDTTRRILHELQPIVGAIRVCAKSEVSKFESSEVARHLDRMQRLLKGIRTLSQSASSPEFEEFELASTIDELCLAEEVESVMIVKSGPRPMIVVADKGLFGIALQNGIRNAIEATLACAVERVSVGIVVTWGETERDIWVAVLDEGMGPPPDSAHVWDVGTSSKSSHFGMGLASARCAMSSLDGQVTLERRRRRGARFEIRWPIRRKRD